MSLNLTVFFEDPFWVGVFSRVEGESAQYCRVVFGGEPSDIEIYHYFLANWRNLEYSEALPSLPDEPLIKNPKRRQRAVSRRLQEHTGQKRSYAIIKQTLQESQKAARRLDQKQSEIEHKNYVLQVKQNRRKEKHKGH
jgi:hypothetical protein